MNCWTSGSARCSMITARSTFRRSLLDKPGKLTATEFLELKKHPVYGYSTLKDLDIFSPVSLGIVKHHHEKENGNGYPDGLSQLRHSQELQDHGHSRRFQCPDNQQVLPCGTIQGRAIDIMYGEMEARSISSTSIL